ncbi:MAG: hypothetical protein KGL46_12590 [Hyphomicrobiales bacterium]|nr:hypothetical protein [Hyphomicrobiales bacterium]
MNAQLALPLEHAQRYGAEDFLVSGANETAFNLVEAWPRWPDCALLIVGDAGAGKSHLAAIWAERAGAIALEGRALQAEADLAQYAGHNLLIENADGVAQERALFHVFNLVQEHGASMLATARTAPDAWALTLPDLRSRLRRAPLARIAPPDDELVRALLVKLFLDRQLLVDQSVVDYIALRIGRSFEAARALVGALDAETLARGKGVTRAAAAEMIERMGRSE